LKQTNENPAIDSKATKVVQPIDPTEHRKTNSPLDITDKPTWGPVVGIVYSLGLAFIGGSTIAALLVSFALTASGMHTSTINDWYSTAWGAFIYSFATAIIAVGVIALYVSKSRSSWRSLGVISPRWKHVGIAVAAVFVYLAIYVVVISVVKTLVPAINLEQQQDLGIASPHGIRELVLVFITLVLLPPIMEETIFRGFMFAGLRTKLPFIVSALITSVLFALGHLQFGSSAPLLWVAAIDTFVLSMVMCYVRERTGSIIPTMIMHALKNLLAFSFLYIFVS